MKAHIDIHPFKENHQENLIFIEKEVENEREMKANKLLKDNGLEIGNME